MLSKHKRWETCLFCVFFDREAALTTSVAQHFRQVDFEDPRLRVLLCGYYRLPVNQWTHIRISLPYWRLYWNPTPGGRIHHGAQTLTLNPDEALLVAPHAVVSSSNPLAIDHLFVHFQLPALLTGHPPPLETLRVTPALRGLGEALIAQLRADPVSPRRLSLAAWAIVYHALMLSEDSRDPAPALAPQVMKALAFVDEHLDADTANADLARAAGLSPGALNRLFKHQVGQTLHAYLRTKRIEKACLLLEFTDDTIDQIAEATGFCDRYYFSRIFKRTQDISPAAFRKLHNNPFASPRVSAGSEDSVRAR